MSQVEGASRGGKKRRGHIINDLTPMVDIAFLLVIFFMTTTVFREPQAIEVSLPPKGSVPTAQSNVVILYIDSLGETSRQLSDSTPVPIAIDSIKSYLLAEERRNVEKQYRGLEFLQQYDQLKPGRLRDSVERFIKKRVSKLVVLIDVHQRSYYQQMVRVMDQVQQAKMARFSIVPHVADTLATKPKRGR